MVAMNDFDPRLDNGLSVEIDEDTPYCGSRMKDKTLG